ncbi:hypothetical protein [Chromobacterium sp. Rain0013]|uniref:hypothetical protein n=1 Tax=Chromobacterium sp. Rain0013 TaxID=2292447 RepID=UPI00188873EB|nr:hypothetical protein [Chromobacterium sp. Rain0013]
MWYAIVSFLICFFSVVYPVTTLGFYASFESSHFGVSLLFSIVGLILAAISIAKNKPLGWLAKIGVVYASSAYTIVIYVLAFRFFIASMDYL